MSMCRLVRVGDGSFYDKSILITLNISGPRNCIGQKFAMYEMKSTLSKILRYYEFSVDKSYEGPVLVAELILKPENGVFVNLRRR